MSNITLTVEAINRLKPIEVVTNEAVKARFVQIYDTLWGAGTGEPAYERESFYFINKLRDDEKLREKSTPFSVFTAFIDLAVCGLSLEPGTRALCYLMGRNYCLGERDGKKIYEGRLVLTISGYGEMVLRARAGQIRHADNPVLVYEEDEFSFGERAGQKVVEYMCHLPHKSGRIVAAFLRITRADGSTDYAVMLPEDWGRLEGYSGRNNRRWDDNAHRYVEKPNELYTSNNGGIDPGFLCAKLIKHAFKTYPKVRIGRGTDLESQQDDTYEQQVDDFYGVEQPVQQDDTYAPAADTSGGVVIDPSSDAPSQQYQSGQPGQPQGPCTNAPADQPAEDDGAF